MTFPEDDLPTVAAAAHAVARVAMDAGVWVLGRGLTSCEEESVVATDGTVTGSPYPDGKAYIGGFSVVTSREEALGWAARSPSPAAALGRFAISCPARRSPTRTGEASASQQLPSRRLLR